MLLALVKIRSVTDRGFSLEFIFSLQRAVQIGIIILIGSDFISLIKEFCWFRHFMTGLCLYPLPLVILGHSCLNMFLRVDDQLILISLNHFLVVVFEHFMQGDILVIE